MNPNHLLHDHHPWPQHPTTTTTTYTKYFKILKIKIQTFKFKIMLIIKINKKSSPPPPPFTVPNPSPEPWSLRSRQDQSGPELQRWDILTITPVLTLELVAASRSTTNKTSESCVVWSGPCLLVFVPHTEPRHRHKLHSDLLWKVQWVIPVNWHVSW